MLKKISEKQTSMEFVCIEQLVPADHLVRTVEAAIDFSFIRERVAGLYCPDNGRPAIEPVVLCKMLFLGYLFGLRSERELARQIQVNIAYRWFLGLSLSDPVPDASTISQNRRRRFNASTIWQEIFDEIVEQAVGHKLVDGTVLYTDSTHLKASANKNKFVRKAVRRSTRVYLADLERDVQRDRSRHGKKPLPPAASGGAGEQETTVKVSTTDPESGYLVREGKPRGFYWLDHRTVDGLCGIITDSHATAATVHDSVPYLARLDRVRRRFGFAVEAVGLDAGYASAAIAKGLEDRGIYGVIGYRRLARRDGYLPKRQFRYESAQDCYWCPRGQQLSYRTTDRGGYRQYVSAPGICASCDQRDSCTRSAGRRKVVTRHVWQEQVEAVDGHRLSERGKAIYARRKETVERSFADAKQLHGHRYARMRGLAKVSEQCLLAAACQNMKKIAQSLWRKRPGGGPESAPAEPRGGIYRWLIGAFQPVCSQPALALG